MTNTRPQTRINGAANTQPERGCKRFMRLLQRCRPSEMDRRRHILFICSRNQWRSPTAERLYWKHPTLNVRSAGTAKSARRRVKLDDLHWADVIFVMEYNHLEQLRRLDRNAIAKTDIHVLDIPDEYGFMDTELVALLRDNIDTILKL